MGTRPTEMQAWRALQAHHAIIKNVHLLSEEPVTSIHARMRALEGRVIREWGDDFLGDLLKKKVNVRRAKLARTAEPATRIAEHLAWELTQLIAGEQEKLERAAENVRKRLEVAKEQLRTTTAALQYQAAHARQEDKIRI